MMVIPNMLLAITVQLQHAHNKWWAWNWIILLTKMYFADTTTNQL